VRSRENYTVRTAQWDSTARPPQRAAPAGGSTAAGATRGVRKRQRKRALDEGTARRPPGSLRIIGGEWRGRRLVIPPESDVRPTPDRVRETLFNWLAARLPGARCLDLFAGTGCLGLEALSRGAAEACLVERDPVLADALAAHVQRLGANARVTRGDARRFLERAPAEAFDVAFLDPPYSEAIEPWLDALLPRLRPGGVVYVERPAERGLPAVAGAEWIKRSRAASVEYGLLVVPATEGAGAASPAE